MSYEGKNNTSNDLAKVGAIAVTMTKHAPSSVEWELSETTIIEQLTDLLKDNVEDVRQVTIEHDNAGNLIAYAWLPRDSKHLIDKSAGANALGKPVRQLSKEIKETMNKFCPKGAQKILGDDNKKSNLVGFPVDLYKAYEVIMDRSGEYSRSKYGEGVKTRLELCPVYQANTAKRFEKLKYLSVKKYASQRNYSKPRPTRGYSH